jgi:hypothetical protein
MKNIYANILGFFLVSILLSGSLFAQNTPKTRLNIKPKAKTSFGVAQRSLYLRNSPTMTTELKINRSTAISDFYRNYYRTLLNIKKPIKTVPVAEPISVSPSLDFKIATEDISGIEKFFTNDKVTVSKIYPNPIDDFADVDFEIKSGVAEVKFVFSNMLGSQVKEQILDKSDKKVHIDFRNLPNGIYFYQLSIDGRTPPVSHKLIIRHQ